MKELLTYSIMSLDTSHLENIDEICQDIRWQYEKRRFFLSAFLHDIGAGRQSCGGQSENPDREVYAV